MHLPSPSAITALCSSSALLSADREEADYACTHRGSSDASCAPAPPVAARPPRRRRSADGRVVTDHSEEVEAAALNRCCRTLRSIWCSPKYQGSSAMSLLRLQHLLGQDARRCAQIQKLKCLSTQKFEDKVLQKSCHPRELLQKAKSVCTLLPLVCYVGGRYPRSVSPVRLACQPVFATWLHLVFHFRFQLSLFCFDFVWACVRRIRSPAVLLRRAWGCASKSHPCQADATSAAAPARFPAWSRWPPGHSPASFLWSRCDRGFWRCSPVCI